MSPSGEYFETALRSGIYSQVYSATYTGGGSGTVSYNWQDLSVLGGTASFVNPVGSSSQRLLLSISQNWGIVSASARCRIQIFDPLTGLTQTSYSEYFNVQVQNIGTGPQP